MAIWDIVFTSPENEDWHLVSNQVHFGLHHDCSGDENPKVQTRRACHYCNDIPPEALWGMYQLVIWDR